MESFSEPRADNPGANNLRFVCTIEVRLVNWLSVSRPKYELDFETIGTISL